MLQKCIIDQNVCWQPAIWQETLPEFTKIKSSVKFDRWVRFKPRSVKRGPSGSHDYMKEIKRTYRTSLGTYIMTLWYQEPCDVECCGMYDVSKISLTLTFRREELGLEGETAFIFATDASYWSGDLGLLDDVMFRVVTRQMVNVAKEVHAIALRYEEVNE